MATIVLTRQQTSASTRIHVPLLSPAQQQSPLDPPSKVRPNLLIGSRETEKDLAALKAAGITHILQAGVELVPSFPKHFSYSSIACSDNDTQDMVELFGAAFDFIDQARQRGVVLVHCAQGISRSATIMLGYLMAREQLPYEEALAQLQQARPQVHPNQGFVLQLKEFGRIGCKLERWVGWNAQRMEQCFAETSVSRRREVCRLSDMIRCFHMADVGEEDTVLDCRNLLL